jgi:hypothetical protein
MVIALVVASSVQQQGVRIGLHNFIELDALLPYSEVWNEICVFQGQKGEEVTLPGLGVRVGSHGGNRHLYGAIERLLVEAGGFVNIVADDHRIDGGTTASASTRAPTKGVGGWWTNK